MNDENTVIENDTGLVVEKEIGKAVMPIESKKSMAAMDKIAAGLAAMKEKYEVMPDVYEKEGYKQADDQRKEIKKRRVDLDHAAKAGKKPLDDLKNLIEARKVEIQAEMKAWEDDRVTALKEADRDRAMKAEVEEARKANIQAGLKKITDQLQSVTLETVIDSIAMLKDTDYEDFEDFGDFARASVADTLAVLSEREITLLSTAEAAAEVEKQRLANEAENAKIKKEREDFEKEKQQLADDKAADEKRRKDEAAAEQKRKDEAAAEEARLAQKVIDDAAAVEAAETKRLADLETARADAVKAEQAKVAAAKAAKAAKKSEKDRLAALAPDQEKLRAWFEDGSEMPDPMETEEGRNIRSEIVRKLQEINDLIEGMTAKAA